MNTNHIFSRSVGNILSIFFILAIAFPSMGSASAFDNDPTGAVVGIVLPRENERWVRDASELQNSLQAAGVAVEILFSEDNADKELTNVETLISHGIQVLIIGPVDAAAVKAVEQARDAGVKVISYDRLIRDTDAVDFYVTFDGVDVGKAQGQYLIDHAQGTGNPLYLYAGARWDNNSFLFFEGAWQVLQPKINDGTFVIKNSSEAVALQDRLELTREEQSAILDQITTNWNYDDAIKLAAANLSTVSAADKGSVFLLAPNDNTARAISDTFRADPDVTSYIITGQDAEQESVQYIMYGRQSMTVFKDLRTLASDAAAVTFALLQGNTPEPEKLYNNGMIDVPAQVSDVVVIDRSNIRSALIDSGYYQSSDFIWHDNFQGPLMEGWEWTKENEEKWEFNDGFLRIYASPYGTGDENLLLRPVTSGDFMIKTHLVFEPDTNYQIAGLVIWQDRQNFLQLGRAFCGNEGSCVGNGLYFDQIGAGDFVDGNFATSIGNPSDVYLRLERRGEMVRAFYSADEGISWYEIGTHWIPSDFQVNGVGLTASQDSYTPDRDIPADFDFFEMTEGRGFLPEGFHDGEQGDVPSWACNASGWAADPDDRTADVNIEIVVDDQSETTLPAGEFRQDLADAGVCEDGYCSFSTGLWDLISSYEPHRVDAWAQDDTGAWVLLSNSAKTLTCRTYDIYAYDPVTGGTKQVTNLPDTHEYNPRWSPDGKKIAHDTWNMDWSSHGVYVTDVNTRVSTPLAGAEGGSYPTWSPSGKWIAFDRGADDDYRLFIVPPTGGTPRLVAEDAFMATWGPRSNRLAFHRPSDGGIWTSTLDGENQTKVVERGNGPAWSPDGEWIAFEVDGDVWKVRVNNTGISIGDPIQLTSSAMWEGRPTWSYNSKTIAFHAGIGQDTDIWTIPAAGGEAAWLTGAPNFGDYDANYSLKGQSQYISYSSFSPDGQAARLWVSAYTYDPPAGTFGEGTHSYHFDFEWSAPEPGSWSGQGGDFVISDDAELYDGYVLLRGPEELHGINYPDGFACEPIGDIDPDQRTRFLIGWLPDYGEIPYSDAKAHFESITANAVWDDGSAELVRHEIIPFNGGNWFNYVCTFTEAPPKMDLRVNYGHDWVESFYEAGHAVEITVTESDGVSVKATASVFTEPKDFWDGATGFQTAPENWSPAPPDLQPYDWVYAQVDNGATARVQLGDIQGEVRYDLDSVTGTITAPWITDPVPVECLDWGSGGGFNKDAGSVLPVGAESYFCGWDPDTEWDVQPWQDIGIGYSTPDGHWVANALRDERWMAVWTYDPPAGSLQEGEHSYYFDLAYTVPEEEDLPPTEPRMFSVSGDTPIYGGYALLGPWSYMPVRVWNGSACEVVSALNPDQPIRFISGWVNDYSMTREEAQAHFNSLTVDLSWNGQAIDSASFTMTGLLPFKGRDARIEYICAFTGDIILDASQPDWVNSGMTVSAGQSFTIEAYGRMNPCSDTYPNGGEICIFYTPVGAEWVVPEENQFGIFPGPGLRFMGLLGRIGDGEPFYIGAGGTFVAEQTGMLWFTPNDNLRTDNQGAYGVLVELAP